MSRTRYKIYEDEYPYLITSSVIYGLPLFGSPRLSDIIINALKFLQNKREAKIYAYVIMENHIHFIAQANCLDRKIAAFKSYTARKCIDCLKNNDKHIWLRRLCEQKSKFKTDRKYQFWDEGYHPKQIIGDYMMVQKVEYIHNNPVKRGYVDSPEDWRYSSAKNYLGESGLFEVTIF
ncbi:REP-associated tyrosine transposase [Fodinibius sp.]|uniref:REP-associated tyrosine transposase n=1 Tax=Fodinibius sp. TaxID=1872440 RepID=UPI002ACE44BE|nr:transposase [Fodinibius sp.]MDZ7657673.1 transposase [Fodinibius sp.]